MLQNSSITLKLFSIQCLFKLFHYSPALPAAIGHFRGAGVGGVNSKQLPGNMLQLCSHTHTHTHTHTYTHTEKNIGNISYYGTNSRKKNVLANRETVDIGRECAIGWERALPRRRLPGQHVKFLSVMSFYSLWQHYISMTSQPLANSDRGVMRVVGITELMHLSRSSPFSLTH